LVSDTKGKHRLRVFQNKALRRIFGPKERKWREAGEDCIMSVILCSPNTIRMIKSKRMRWAGHIARTAEMRN